MGRRKRASKIPIAKKQQMTKLSDFVSFVTPLGIYYAQSIL